MAIRDRFDRVIDYMRISVTDRCNLRCAYCMPSCGVQLLGHGDILSDSEIIRIVRIAAGLGVRKIRLTGGEPLLRPGLVALVASLSGIEGIEDMSLTTNGLLLGSMAGKLAEAGLRRVNVSLDSLKPERYRAVTRGGSMDDVLRGITAAEDAGLLPVKINMIPIRGFNDDEIEDFARLTLHKPFQVRFIEFMPIGAREFWSPEKYVPTDEIRARVSAVAPIEPLKIRRSGTARYYTFEGAAGVLGLISPVTHHFCSMCNRLRLTSDGKLRPCLFSEREIDVKSALRCGAADEEIEALLRLSVEAKPEGHMIGHGSTLDHLKPMSMIGG